MLIDLTQADKSINDLVMKKILFALMILSNGFLFAQQSVSLWVKENKAFCGEDSLKNCFQVRHSQSEPWNVTDKDIEGFKFKEGYRYQLKVSEYSSDSLKENSTSNYLLQEVVSKKRIEHPSFSNAKLVLTRINGKPVVNDAVNIVINANSELIHGNSGCNNFFMGFNFIKSDRIKTNQAGGTLMSCDSSSMKLEQEFLDAFMQKTFKLKQRKNEVTFKSLDNKQELIFKIVGEKEIKEAIKDVKWTLAQMQGVVKDYNGAFISFDLSKGLSSGNAGCNNFFGAFAISGNKISFENLSSGLKACLNPEVSEIEQQFLESLTNKEFDIELTNSILNFYQNGILILSFRK